MSCKITSSILKKSYKPYDIVIDINNHNNVGFIQEISINQCQDEPIIQYAICWLAGNNTKFAWFEHFELIKSYNLFEKIAEASCQSRRNQYWIKKLFKNW